MSEAEDRIRALEERMAALERRVAVLAKKLQPAPSQGRARDLRDRYDALDYPER